MEELRKQIAMLEDKLNQALDINYQTPDKNDRGLYKSLSSNSILTRRLSKFSKTKAEDINLETK
jgi:hypothetical protein